MKTGKDKLSKSSFNLSGISMLPVLSLCAVVLSGIVSRMSEIEILKVGILTLILTTASVLFIRLQEENTYNQRIPKLLMIGGYLLPLFLILLPTQPHIYCFWMLGGISVAMLVDARLGLLYIFNHTFLLSFLLSLRPEIIVYYLVMGVLICMLSEALKNKTTIVYAGIIILSTNITLAFVLNNFLFEFRSDFNYISSFFSIFAVLVIAFFIFFIFDSFIRNQITKQLTVFEEMGSDKVDKEARKPDIEPDTITSEASETINPREQSSETSLSTMELTECDETCPAKVLEPVYKDRGARTSYELLINDHNGLLDKMKEYSEVLYQHSLQIADLSARAAKIVDADPIIARAGGLYHEVGKIQGKDYILEGQRIAEEYGFPKTLKAILRQHNIKHEKPASVEAAIVMLSDNVVSTIEYIKKTDDKRYTIDKLIDNLFQLRMDKGTFDESGLSVKDFKLLKDFYQDEFRSL